MRLANRVLSALLAFTLLAGGLLVAIEIAIAGAGRDPWIVPWPQWFDNARSNDWATPAVRAVLVILCLVGLILLFLQVAKRRPPTYPLTRAESGVHFDVDRRSVERSLAATARSVDGVSAAGVQLWPTVARVSAATNRREEGDLQARVQRGVARKLEGLGLESSPPVRVDVKVREAR